MPGICNSCLIPLIKRGSFFFVEAKKENQKIQELVAAAKRHAMTNKDDIVLESWDPEDCVGRMVDSVDSFAADFILKDDFFKEVPEDAIQKLEQQLEPIFKDAYVIFLFSLLRWQCFLLLRIENSMRRLRS